MRLEPTKDSKLKYYDELSNKDHVKVHPIILLNLLNISDCWEQISRYHFMLDCEDFTLTCSYDKERNDFIFEKHYSGNKSEIADNLVRASKIGSLQADIGNKRLA